MEVSFKLSKNDVEAIIIEHFQARGYEPDVNLRSDGTYSVDVQCDMECFDDKF